MTGGNQYVEYALSFIVNDWNEWDNSPKNENENVFTLMFQTCMSLISAEENPSHSKYVISSYTTPTLRSIHCVAIWNI